MSFDYILKGFMTAAPLIVAIGAQNAFVLRQGLLKQYVLSVVLVCAFADTVLMSLGIMGLGRLVESNMTAQWLLAGAGAVFLIWYGWGALKRLLTSQSMVVDGTENKQTLGKVIAAVLAITLLNPHVYLDTVVLIGGISSTVPAEYKTSFLIGSISSSWIWFFCLGYGARLLTPWFKKEITWKVLDVIIALVMFFIASQLLLFIYKTAVVQG